MNSNNFEQVKFFSEMAERQLVSKEFFTKILLDSIEENYGITGIRIFFYTPYGKFLTIREPDGQIYQYKENDIGKTIENNSVRKKIYEEGVRDKLTYFDVEPRIYLSSEMIAEDEYEESEYVKMLQEMCGGYYSATMVFGINAYIEVLFCKTKEEGNFTQDEMEVLRELFVFLGNGYKTYKKHEQSKIVSVIQNQVIALGEKAYLVVDDFLHILSYNDKAVQYLQDVLGHSIEEQMEYENTNYWLNLILGNEEGAVEHEQVRFRNVKDYVFRIQTHDQFYSNNIIDRYHWITITREKHVKQVEQSKANVRLTKTEQKVAQLLYEGLTYKEIADELVVSYHTVKKHVQNIYSKCQVSRRHELYNFFDNKNMNKKEK